MARKRSSSALPPPSTLSQALAEKIRERLKEQGWSQRTFATRLGLTQGAVSYLLAGRRRASVLDYYQKLATEFGLSLSVLIADLEQRVSTPPAAETFVAHRREDSSIVFEAVLGLLLDEKLEAIHASLSAQVQAGFQQLATAPSKKRRSTPAKKAQADDQDVELHHAS